MEESGADSGKEENSAETAGHVDEDSGERRCRSKAGIYCPYPFRSDGRRLPTCVSCKNHGLVMLTRGHRASCPYKNCTCPQCARHQSKLCKRTATKLVEKLKRSRPPADRCSELASPDSSSKERANAGVLAPARFLPVLKPRSAPAPEVTTSAADDLTAAADSGPRAWWYHTLGAGQPARLDGGCTVTSAGRYRPYPALQPGCDVYRQYLLTPGTAARPYLSLPTWGRALTPAHLRPQQTIYRSPFNTWSASTYGQGSIWNQISYGLPSGGDLGNQSCPAQLGDGGDPGYTTRTPSQTQTTSTAVSDMPAAVSSGTESCGEEADGGGSPAAVASDLSIRPRPCRDGRRSGPDTSNNLYNWLPSQIDAELRPSSTAAEPRPASVAGAEEAGSRAGRQLASLSAPASLLAPLAVGQGGPLEPGDSPAVSSVQEAGEEPAASGEPQDPALPGLQPGPDPADVTASGFHSVSGSGDLLEPAVSGFQPGVSSLRMIYVPTVQQSSAVAGPPPLLTSAGTTAALLSSPSGCNGEPAAGGLPTGLSTSGVQSPYTGLLPSRDWQPALISAAQQLAPPQDTVVDFSQSTGPGSWSSVTPTAPLPPLQLPSFGSLCKALLSPPSAGLTSPPQPGEVTTPQREQLYPPPAADPGPVGWCAGYAPGPGFGFGYMTEDVNNNLAGVEPPGRGPYAGWSDQMALLGGQPPAAATAACAAVDLDLATAYRVGYGQWRPDDPAGLMDAFGRYTGGVASGYGRPVLADWNFPPVRGDWTPQAPACDWPLQADYRVSETSQTDSRAAAEDQLAGSGPAEGGLLEAAITRLPPLSAADGSVWQYTAAGGGAEQTEAEGSFIGPDQFPEVVLQTADSAPELGPLNTTAAAEQDWPPGHGGSPSGGGGPDDQNWQSGRGGSPGGEGGPPSRGDSPSGAGWSPDRGSTPGGGGGPGEGSPRGGPDSQDAPRTPVTTGPVWGQDSAAGGTETEPDDPQLDKQDSKSPTELEAQAAAAEVLVSFKRPETTQ